MMYSRIDPVLDAWASLHSLKLFRAFGGQERRFCYMSSAQNECFQISIEPPRNGEVSINAWSVETRNDEEMHHEWVVPITDLPKVLDTALAKVTEWMTR